MRMYSGQRLILFLCVVLFVITVLSGCYVPTLFLEFDEHGNTPVTIVVTGGEMVSEDEMACVFSQLKMLLPELAQDYDCWIQGKEIRLIRHEKASAKDFSFITLARQSDGSYMFEARLPALYAAQKDSDDVFLKLQITLPAEIDLANTVDVDGKTAVWTIRKNQLHKEQKLRAVTIAQ